jgi:hypothetical protein
LTNGERHADRRGWRVVARFKDDGYSAFKEIKRDDFVNLIETIERDVIDVVIVRDVDRLTRNLPDWSRFEKAAIEHKVILSAYAGGDLDLSTPEGAYYGGMETLRAKRESAVRSARVREAHNRIARQGKSSGGGRGWFGYARRRDRDNWVRQSPTVTSRQLWTRATTPYPHTHRPRVSRAPSATTPSSRPVNALPAPLLDEPREQGQYRYGRHDCHSGARVVNVQVGDTCRDDQEKHGLLRQEVLVW